MLQATLETAGGKKRRKKDEPLCGTINGRTAAKRKSDCLVPWKGENEWSYCVRKQNKEWACAKCKSC